ncbi:MAG: hypothetical protein KGJ88_02595 [Verrucomicrobiota bacterium]|nr:hypothetical protein [Verrucomicrobiota bacterium]
MSREDAGEWVTVEGTVTFLSREGRRTYLEVRSESGSMPVEVAHGAGFLTGLMLDGRVRVKAVCEPVYNAVEQQWVGSLAATNVNDFTLLQVPEETWRRIPLMAIDKVKPAEHPADFHLVGRVESVELRRSFVLSDGTNEITVGFQRASEDMDGQQIEALCGWQIKKGARKLECGLWRPYASPQSPAALPVLTSAAQIRWLQPSEAERKYPVRIHGVITYKSSDGKANIQDGTGGLLLAHLGPTSMENVTAGDYCEVDGTTERGEFSPVVRPRKIRVLGKGQFPEAVLADWDQLISGGLDAEWVQIDGAVLSAGHNKLKIHVQGGSVECYIRGNNPYYYPGAILHVRGVVLVAHHRDGRISGVTVNVPGQQFVAVEMRRPRGVFSIPMTHIGDLFRYKPDQGSEELVRVRGQVIHAGYEECYLMDGASGMRVVTTKALHAEPGDIVEVVGFPVIKNPFGQPTVTLQAAFIQDAGHATLGAPVAVTADALLNPAHNDTLIRVSGRLLNISSFPNVQLLKLQTGSLVYQARLDSGKTPQFLPGSILDLTGVYAAGSNPSIPFQLLINSSNDIHLLAPPSWWTQQRAMGTVIGMGGLIVLAVVWIAVLRREVKKRTIELSAANHVLTSEMAEQRRTEVELVQTRSERLLEQERARIARDLHEELGSRVARLVLLNDWAVKGPASPEAVTDHAREISAAARQMIQSLDETIWAIQPGHDTLPHLFNYAGEFATEFLKLSGVRHRLDFPDYLPARAVSAETQDSVFLALKQALKNAVRYGHATEVRLTASLAEESATLTIQDNGRRREQDPATLSADILASARARLEEAGGRLDVESIVDNGTRVSLTFPLIACKDPSNGTNGSSGSSGSNGSSHQQTNGAARNGAAKNGNNGNGHAHL